MIPYERSLVDKLNGRPFALIGINSDSEKATYFEKAKEMGVTWRSSWQGSTSGPVPTEWGVTSWPTLFLIDHEGVIRETDSMVLRDEEKLAEAIEQLVREAEAAKTAR